MRTNRAGPTHPRARVGILQTSPPGPTHNPQTGHAELASVPTATDAPPEAWRNERGVLLQSGPHPRAPGCSRPSVPGLSTCPVRVKSLGSTTSEALKQNLPARLVPYGPPRRRLRVSEGHARRPPTGPPLAASSASRKQTATALPRLRRDLRGSPAATARTWARDSEESGG